MARHGKVGPKTDKDRWPLVAVASARIEPQLPHAITGAPRRPIVVLLLECGHDGAWNGKGAGEPPRRARCPECPPRALEVAR